LQKICLLLKHAPGKIACQAFFSKIFAIRFKRDLTRHQGHLSAKKSFNERLKSFLFGQQSVKKTKTIDGINGNIDNT
jgi:hypothetical protein